MSGDFYSKLSGARFVVGQIDSGLARTSRRETVSRPRNSSPLRRYE